MLTQTSGRTCQLSVTNHLVGIRMGSNLRLKKTILKVKMEKENEMKKKLKLHKLYSFLESRMFLISEKNEIFEDMKEQH